MDYTKAKNWKYWLCLTLTGKTAGLHKYPTRQEAEEGLIYWQARINTPLFIEEELKNNDE